MEMMHLFAFLLSMEKSNLFTTSKNEKPFVEGKGIVYSRNNIILIATSEKVNMDSDYFARKE